MASELEQLRNENRRLRDAAITVMDRVGRAGVQGWSMQQFLNDGSVAELVDALAHPAPAPAEGQQPEPASDGEDADDETQRQVLHKCYKIEQYEIMTPWLRPAKWWRVELVIGALSKTLRCSFENEEYARAFVEDEIEAAIAASKGEAND